MTKQKEILRAVANWFEQIAPKHPDTYCEAELFLEMLQSKGVVLKVEGELPQNVNLIKSIINEPRTTMERFYEIAQQDMLDAGYSLTEDLI